MTHGTAASPSFERYARWIAISLFLGFCYLYPHQMMVVNPAEASHIDVSFDDETDGPEEPLAVFGGSPSAATD